ncbi:hypothetical protein BX661DRAFT_168346 [Kickxella alabastrina]|uniref:uncharacterized protein n=1 Tax=Kickxella alabastrina TaxID=61397 RepID=UPI00221FE5F0|nr:uncharacterized protein BX661DRAFT_168346 [Kickxella alabastrina]KAI7835185.1 hypothetical protein BX661DRAFT_168346 [Kickxella alabastrina]
MLNNFSTVAVFVLGAVSTATAHDATAANSNSVQQPHNFARSNVEHAKRCGGWGGCGRVGCGGGGWGWGGFPFAANTVNAFDRNTFAANCCDNTVFANNKNANVVCNNLHALNAANVIAPR